jgi:hypothetical protein
MNEKKAKALRRLAWKGRGNPPGSAVMEDVGKPFSTETVKTLRCWGPRAVYREMKEKARRDGKDHA